MIEKYFTWLFYADFIIPLILFGAAFLLLLVSQLVELIARGWDRRQKRMMDDKQYRLKKEMCEKAMLCGLCPKDCKRCSWGWNDE